MSTFIRILNIERLLYLYLKLFFALLTFKTVTSVCQSSATGNKPSKRSTELEELFHIILLPLYRATDNWSPPKSKGYNFLSSTMCSDSFTMTDCVTFCDGTYLCKWSITSIISSFFISFFNCTPSGTCNNMML